MKNAVHFEPYAVEKYHLVTSEVSQAINKIAVSLENDGEQKHADDLRKVMEKVCDINMDLEDPDGSMEKLRRNAAVLKHGIDVMGQQDDIRIEPQCARLQGLYDCGQRIFEVDFEKDEEKTQGE